MSNTNQDADTIDRNRRRRTDLFIPLALLALISLLFRLTDLDLIISSSLYSPTAGWLYADRSLVQLLYRYGTYPALALGSICLGWTLLSLVIDRLRFFRRQAIFFVLVLVLGPGLVVNACFKDHWGRPRPREVIELGGEQKFLPVWQKGVTGQGRSFPSGHASTGFFLMTPFFLYRFENRQKGLLFLGLGLGYGVLMGMGRIIQGGHFASDVLWSAGFVYLTGFLLSRLMKIGERGSSPRP